MTMCYYTFKSPNLIRVINIYSYNLLDIEVTLVLKRNQQGRVYYLKVSTIFNKIIFTCLCDYSLKKYNINTSYYEYW